MHSGPFPGGSEGHSPERKSWNQKAGRLVLPESTMGKAYGVGTQPGREPWPSPGLCMRACHRRRGSTRLGLKVCVLPGALDAVSG